MAKFSIHNVVVDEDLGTYEANSEDQALDAMAQSFGFADYADCVRDYGVDVKTGKSELQITAV